MVPAAVYHSLIGGGGGEWRCRERSSFLEKVWGRGFKEEVAFALHPERQVGVQ